MTLLPIKILKAATHLALIVISHKVTCDINIQFHLKKKENVTVVAKYTTSI